MPTLLPEPPPGWPAKFTQAVNSIFNSIGARLQDVERKRTNAGKIGLSPVKSTYSGEVPCNGALYNRKDVPDLFRIISTDFNTGGELATQFRVPNLTSPSPGKLEYRISIGNPV